MEENKVIETNETETNQTETLDSLKAQLEKLTADNEKLKRAQSNASADASKYKKMLNERMTEQEQRESAEAEEKQKLIERLAELERATTVANGKAGFLALGSGMTDALAQGLTEAFLDKDMNALMSHLTSFITERDRVRVAEAIRNTPTPATGNNNGDAVSKEDFDKMSYKQRVELYEKNPELYKKLNS